MRFLPRARRRNSILSRIMKNTDYSESIFGIQSESERNFWVSYHIFVLLSSLVGDTLILIGSFNNDAFKVNKFLLTVIQHIAVCDLGTTLSSVLPQTVSLLANSWVMGNTACYIRAYVGYIFVYLAGMSLIAVLTTSKFLILRYPLRAANWITERRAHQICGFVWASSLMSPIFFLAIQRDDVYFDYRSYNCRYRYSHQAWEIILLFTGLFYDIIPNVAIIATTVPTLKYLAAARKSARRAQGSVPWQGALTVALTSIVYCTSTLPSTIYILTKHFVKEKDPTGWFHVNFYRISTFLLLINVMSNFFIYTLTIRSFRMFLFSKIFRCFPMSLQISRKITLETIATVKAGTTGRGKAGFSIDRVAKYEL